MERQRRLFNNIGIDADTVDKQIRFILAVVCCSVLVG